MDRARFVRTTPDKRRQDLIDATARCLAERGVAGASVREICKRAGVSAGLLTHYFKGIDALVVETYRDVTSRVAAEMDRAVAEAGDDPGARLNAYVLASFRPPVLDVDLLATWIAFWGLVKSDPEIAAAHRESYGGFRGALERLIEAAKPTLDPAEVRLAAIAITATIDGLWLELCLDHASFTPQEAERMARTAIDRLLASPIPAV